MTALDDADPYAGLTRDDIRATWLAYSANRLRFKRELERVWSNTHGVTEAAIRQHKADLQVSIAACDIEMEALEQAYRSAQPEPVEPVARERA